MKKNLAYFFFLEIRFLTFQTHCFILKWTESVEKYRMCIAFLPFVLLQLYKRNSDVQRLLEGINWLTTNTRYDDYFQELTYHPCIICSVMFFSFIIFCMFTFLSILLPTEVVQCCRHWIVSGKSKFYISFLFTNFCSISKVLHFLPGQ